MIESTDYFVVLGKSVYEIVEDLLNIIDIYHLKDTHVYIVRTLEPYPKDISLLAKF